MINTLSNDSVSVRDNVKRTASGGRIYEQVKIDDAPRTDWSGLHINYGFTPAKRTFREILVSLLTFGLF